MFHYTRYVPVYDAATGDPVLNRTDGEALDEAGNPVTVYDGNTGLPATIRTGPTGLLVGPLKSDVEIAAVRFGTVAVGLDSDEQRKALPRAIAAEESAALSAARAEAAEAKAFPVSNVGIRPDGTPYISDQPVALGGFLRINPDGSVTAVFPY